MTCTIHYVHTALYAVDKGLCGRNILQSLIDSVMYLLTISSPDTYHTVYCNRNLIMSCLANYRIWININAHILIHISYSSYLLAQVCGKYLPVQAQNPERLPEHVQWLVDVPAHAEWLPVHAEWLPAHSKCLHVLAQRLPAGVLVYAECLHVHAAWLPEGLQYGRSEAGSPQHRDSYTVYIRSTQHEVATRV